MSYATTTDVINADVKLTPMMEQYFEIKSQYPGIIVLFRMGDFYEVFFEDAVEVSKRLNITLTHRGKVGDIEIPMAGIPHHAAPAYVDRLTGQGLRIAIAEQIQDPKDAVGIVKRAVTQVVSPSLPYDLERADKDQKFMACAARSKDCLWLVLLDFTTGDFVAEACKDDSTFIEKLRLHSPRELITFMGQWDDLPEINRLCEHEGILKTHLSSDYFSREVTKPWLTKIVPTYNRDQTLKKHVDVLGPVGALAYYVGTTQQIENFTHIRPLRLSDDSGSMQVTLPTLTGLEILPKSRDHYKESLLGFMDRCQSSLGNRMIKRLMVSPLTDEKQILARQNFIEYLISDISTLEDTREELSKVRDLERIMAKISTGKATGGDLLNIASSIEVYQAIELFLVKAPIDCLNPLSESLMKKLEALKEVIRNTINDEIGAALDKGNLIRPGSNKNRDKLAKLAGGAKEELQKLEERYQQETGFQKLRVKSNNIFGYFVEIPKSLSDKMPKTFERRQTLVNTERYITDELSALEKDMMQAKIRLEKVEREIFNALIEEIKSLNEGLGSLSTELGMLDAFTSFAFVSWQEDFAKPNVKQAHRGVELQGAWHPLIKATLKDAFVCHDLTLTKERSFGLITGPNMAGKTTVMREVAIVQLLAQVGCFVPAKAANLGVCDFLFSRLGASDDILRGHSTFMVEMAETAEILRHATDRSLIILDEVGRGTSTWDGLSIAWALVEWLIDETKATTLFATHYHELIELIEDRKSAAKNLTVETKSLDGDVQFLYRLVEKAASQSFGIYVAKLAGLPKPLLARAQEVLHGLENHEQQPTKIQNTQLSFFEDDAKEVELPVHFKRLEKQLSKVDVMQMTPLEALQKLHELKTTWDESRNLS
ncbi:MAG: DNA mismatch repair protein MutS [Bdellovibrionales bacterium CG12_big_fil_rev_8_21_14_0_65_38_15]|nr:MAG: DNA mismatch repair protein MutS [Bdellovibrionales bacterium CG12_big_fil_rev_8_21_14_0_65_38_15]